MPNFIAAFLQALGKVVDPLPGIYAAMQSALAGLESRSNAEDEHGRDKSAIDRLLLTQSVASLLREVTYANGLVETAILREDGQQCALKNALVQLRSRYADDMETRARRLALAQEELDKEKDRNTGLQMLLSSRDRELQLRINHIAQLKGDCDHLRSLVERLTQRERLTERDRLNEQGRGNELAVNGDGSTGAARGVGEPKHVSSKSVDFCEDVTRWSSSSERAPLASAADD